MPPSPVPLSDAELLAHYNATPFYKNHNLHIEVMSEGKAAIVVNPVTEIFRGGMGTDAMNGGMVAYVIDGVTGAAIGSLARGTKRTGTLNLNVQYLKGLRGDSIHASAVVTRFGRRVGFATAEVRDAEGTLCAVGQATYAIIDW